ncbi:hypothetical protein [Bosea sp. RAC05]|uniref:hypothetical protein n=1 Tax=Bosea sp. RAC05 TaxID=1842539 RepID=UPI00083CF9A9|nr:hypothetical protein [Bosea sp. RAC05]
MLPATLNDTLAATTGVESATVRAYMRVLRENGYLSKHGRGIAAAKMSDRDASVCLTALAGAPRPLDVLPQVKHFSKTVFSQGDSGGLLGMLSEKGSGIDAVADLIRLYTQGLVEQHFETIEVEPAMRHSSMDVVFLTTAPVSIQFRIIKNGQLLEARMYQDPSDDITPPDLRSYRRVSGRTFDALAASFHATVREDL